MRFRRRKSVVRITVGNQFIESKKNVQLQNHCDENKRTIYRLEAIHDLREKKTRTQNINNTVTAANENKLVRLCANWKAVKNGLICMDHELHQRAGEWNEHNQSFGMHSLQ